MHQNVLPCDPLGTSVRDYLNKYKIKRIFLVCGNSFLRSELWEQIQDNAGIDIVVFSDFSPNPERISVEKGKKKFVESRCDAIVAAGGGSCIDVAKCIKLSLPAAPVPFLVIPTTAGSGSESTRFAVIYENGEKQSITEERCIPDAVYYDDRVLLTLPDYQKKATMLDALCHGIESFWSVNSTEESKKYSRLCIQMILNHGDAYLNNMESVFHDMFLASSLGGKAINITQTTAGHAMCYKLTKQYGYAHGHAAALCNVWLWHYMISHMEDCVDNRGRDYLESVFLELAEVMGCDTIYEAAEKFQNLVDSMELPHTILQSDIPGLSAGVHLQRLRNNPVKLDQDAIIAIYTAAAEWKMPGKEQ